MGTDKSKCACPNCVCEVDSQRAVKRDGKDFCSESCASGHKDGKSGCGHSGCNCG